MSSSPDAAALGEPGSGPALQQPAATPRTSAVHNPTHTPELDLPKLLSLPAEQQDLFLLTFVSTLRAHVLSLPADDCTAQQFYLKKEVFQILNLTTPPPSRVVRNNVGPILAHIFEHGDRKLLFETVNDLVNIISNSKTKTDAEARTRHAAVTCLGDVYAAAGDSVIGLHPLACSALLKLLKNTSSNAGLRGAVLTSLSKIVGMVGPSMDETIARDIWKQGRNVAANDKGHLAIVAACRCLRALSKNTPYFETSGEFDKATAALFKAMDSSSTSVRHAAAECLAEAMVKSHSELGAAELAAAKSKKGKAKQNKRASMAPGAGLAEEDDLPTSRPGSPAPGGSKKSQALVMSVVDMLNILSTHYVRMSTTNKTRAALAVCYGRVLRKLGEKIVEANYLRIVENLTLDLLGNPSIANNRYRLLISRRIVDTILQDVVGRKILGESGQMSAAKAVINDIFKNYPQALKERPEPTKQMLIAALGAVASLVESLGSAANNFAEPCRDGLLQVLQHPSYSVQVYASRCLKSFVLACPQQLLPCLSVCMNSLSRELSLLGGGRNSPRRCVGFAHGLAATLSASPSRPLYGSVDINSRVLSMATNLLKSSGKSELRVSSTQIQVAWILIGGLMSLGPNFVKIHLSQLLLLLLEASFLTHVRECALGSILAFLQFNSRLLTVDVSKRIATMLQSTTAFLRTLPSKKVSDDISQRLTPALQLHDLELMVQRRVLQCYIKLVNQSPAGGSEALLQSNLLTLAISLFADPENYGTNSLGASIANVQGALEVVWEVGDNSGFGITGLINGFKLKKLPGQQQESSDEELTKAESDAYSSIDDLLKSPICPSLEHDAAVLYVGSSDQESLPDPPATEVVNMAIQLFAFVFPLTPAKVQESILEQVVTFLSAGALQRDPGRKAAINVNVAAALLSTLRVAVKETSSAPGDVTNLAVEKLLQEIVRSFVIDPDQYVRNMGYAALARLCNTCGNAFTNHEIKHLVDTIVGNREPSARAGCAMALGSIQAKVGGMAAGYHLKTILGILMSLCNDPHPTVHFWALEALSLAADAAGLGFSSFVPSTLGMLAQLYLSDTHHLELSSAITMNLEMELSTPAAIARCVDSLVNVLGPDLQESTKSRELILTLVGQLQEEEDILVQRASLGCSEHLSLYAPGNMMFADYVKLLQKYFNGDVGILRDAAVDGLYNLMKRNSRDVFEAAEPGLEDQLWLVLDNVPSHDGIRNIIRNWMRQTSLEDTANWLIRLQDVLRMTRPKAVDSSENTSKKQSAAVDLRDEEVAGFAAAGGVSDDKEAPAGSEVEPLRWQVRTFAIGCLSDIFALINKDIATNGESPAQAALQSKVAEVVRMAFSASTSSVLELRIWGLKIIGAVLRMFGKSPDPDFEEAMLLEQYQAQISSALTPAFAADSSPELASEAVNVCAAFIATGIVTDVDRMGRILKTLVSALENFSSEAEHAGIGDLQGLSSNAQVMVKMSVFSAWADLQVASTEQKYLHDVLKPHIGKLTPLWLSSLREFARLRFEPDISMTLGPPSLSGSLDTIYAALNRETLLRFYQESWLKLVDAIASLIEQDSEFVFDALDGKETDGEGMTTNGKSKGPEINYRDEPVAFFFVLFGVAFEALATRPGQADSLATQEQTLEILQALKKIVHPSVSGHAIYRDAIFSETMDLLDRLVLTEGLDVQAVIVEIARALCVAHPSARKKEQPDNGGDLTEDIEQLFELTRIIVLVLSGMLPNLVEAGQPVRHQLTEEAVLLIRTGLSAIVDAAEVFPDIIKTDLHACIIHIFATILATPTCQDIIVPQALPMLKRFIASMCGAESSSNNAAPDYKSLTHIQLQGCLRRFLSIYLNAQKRELPSSLQCNQLAANDGLVSRFLDEVIDCLTDRMTAKIAANCVRSLLLQASPTPADQSIARYLLPRLVSFVTNTDPEDPEGARKLVALSLAQYVSHVGPDHAQIVMAIVAPTLLSRAASEGQGVYAETSARLLEMAASGPEYQAAFRGIVAAMSEGQKAFMEEVIRHGRSQREEAAADKNGAGSGGGQPTIALKMDFGV
ncbi:uncharacterized protein PG986_015055 [Apiospora aurea]|uniref:LAA1-like C-terminal TPR repeats domain-containing protein n=1 Tax=Apiospora aurea TaxID=335848 RepID=A0ABR1PRH9_9PEZI